MVKIPSSWKDCSTAQIIEGLELQMLLQSYGSYPEVVLELLGDLVCLLTQLDRNSYELLSNDEKFELIEQLRWATVDKVTELPFTSFHHRGRRYFLPKPHYADTSSIELAMANMHYLAFVNGTKAASPRLFDLLATICRPRKWNWRLRRLLPGYDGEDRQIYNSLRAEQRAVNFQNLRLGVCIAILQYWEAQNNEFYEIHKALYDGAGGRSLFQNGEGWLATLEDVASAGVHGNFDKVCDTNAHTIWMYLKHRKIQIAEQQSLAEEEKK
ncbi:hypothetical protein [Runella sp.]|uniref:hypothetical protein n=1 Tax=Runella sp. TaxID=1960881 RepID=UPI003D0A8A63